MIRPFLPETKHRFIAELISVVLLALIAGTGLAAAQDTTTRKLQAGQTVTGTLDAKSFAQTYTFDAKNGETYSLTATSQASGLFLAMLLSGPDGNVLSQNSDLTKAAVTINNVTIPADGTYTITVLRATGAQGTVKGNFVLTLTGGSGGSSQSAATQAATTQPTTPPAASTQAATTPPSAATVTLSQGMSVALSWGTADDMNLEVRDPVGGDVSHNSPSAPSGGRLSNDVNANCATATADSPTETIGWPAGNVPSGSYEIIVYYNKACTAAASGATPAATEAAAGASGGAPVNFAISVTINGDTREPIRGTLTSGQQYVASFLLTSADQVTIFPGGVLAPAPDLTPFASKISAPKTLTTGAAVTGSIDHNNAADAWSFKVTQANQPVTITMNATTGSLDTFLVLVGADGQVIASNDDANDNTRNSQLANQTLSAGTYTVIATRFALQLGGTEGSYSLLVSNGRTATTNVVAPTVAPASTNSTTSSVSASLPTGSIAITLTWNSRADLRLLIRDPNGVSVYSDNRTPDNSGILDRLGNFKCLDTNTSPITYAYWPSNQTLTPGAYEVSVWQQSRCTDTSIQPQYNLVVNVNGKDIIKHADRPDTTGLHLLTTFTLDASGNATAGPAGIIREQFTGDISAQLNNNPQALSYGTAVNGTIDANNPFVIYTFTAKAGDKVAIAMRNTAGNLDPNLFLLGPDGKTQLAANDDQDPGKIADSRIEIPNATLAKFPADGTYVVVATRYGVQFGGTTGNYELTIAQLNQ